jgi:hypothetical protein
MKAVQGKRNLLHIIRATGASARLPCGLDSGNENGNEYGNNSHDNNDFNDCHSLGCASFE